VHEDVEVFAKGTPHLAHRGIEAAHAN
jgi:hypothetical protein